MKILYFGDDSKFSTSFHRAEALRRLGYQVEIYNPQIKMFPKNEINKVSHFFHYRTGYAFIQEKVLKWLKSLRINENDFQLIWINSGEFFGERCLKYLRVFKKPVILYNNDDPTGYRDGARFSMVRKALRHYDLCAIRNEKPLDDYFKLGCKNVVKIFMSYDEEFHKPFVKKEEISDLFFSEVAFIGTWIKQERRDEFLAKLIDAGINVAIWGNRWEKSPSWKKIKSHFRGGALGGKDYVAAVQGSKICLGLLSKANRDLHTRRSVEIPYAGGLLCAERTSIHLAMYRENIDAIFWKDAEECIMSCKNLLENDFERERIRLNGMKRVRQNGFGNEEICNQILKALAEDNLNNGKIE